MKIQNTIWAFIIVSLLAGCNGHSGSSGGSGSAGFDQDTDLTDKTLEITLSIKDENCEQAIDVTLENNEIACIEASFTADSTGVSGQLISFSSDIGTLSAETKLTDNNGIAQIFIRNPDLASGASALTATYSADVIDTLNYQYEITDSGGNETNYALQLSFLDSSCNQITDTTLTDDESKCIQTVLTANGEPASGQIISFSAPIGVLSTSSKLTDEQGIAQINLSNPDRVAGAAEFTASYQEQVSEVSNYELLTTATIATESDALNLVISKNGVSTIQFLEGDSVNISATASKDGNPVANIPILFSTEKGDLTKTSALTDSTGTATTTLLGQREATQGIEVELLGATLITAVADTDNFAATDSSYAEIIGNDDLENSEVQFGYFTNDGAFIEGELGISSASISSGGSSVISVGLLQVSADGSEAFTSPTQITFSSSCAQNSKATLDTSLITVNGEISSTYQDIQCSSVESASTDIITATTQVNGDTKSIQGTLVIQPSTLGSLSLVSVEPEQIDIKGNGSAGSNQFSTVTFLVQSGTGTALGNIPVNFSLTTQAGGLSLFPETSVTNSDGLVSTRVQSGFLPTNVSVNASALINDVSITSQSNELIVSNGALSQGGFRIAADILNVDAIGNNTVNFTVVGADINNNPAPDGTTVLFEAEAGIIEPSCQLANGFCSVQWTYDNFSPEDNRATIIARAVGNEHFVDINSNGIYDSADGEPYRDTALDSGIFYSNYARDDGESFTDQDNDAQFDGPGFADMSEAFLDNNENGIRDAEEPFYDFDGSGTFSDANNQFGGLCQSSSDENCDQSLATATEVRDSMVLVTSDRNFDFSVTNIETGDVIAFDGQSTIPTLSFSDSDIPDLQLKITDSKGQVLSHNATISISASVTSLNDDATVVEMETQTIDIPNTQYSSTDDIPSYNIILSDASLEPFVSYRGSLEISVTYDSADNGGTVNVTTITLEVL